MKRAGAALGAVLWLVVRHASAHGEPCTAVGGEDTCPQGEACTLQDGGTGACASPPCTTDFDCAQPLPFCDTTRTPAVCIQCRADSECSAPRPYCELDLRSNVSNLCVECTVVTAGVCASSEKGTRCIPTRGSCGCLRDDDCAPGHVCSFGGTCAVATADAGSDAATEAGAVDAGIAPTAPHGAGGCSAAPSDRAAWLAPLLVLAAALSARASSRLRGSRRAALRRAPSCPGPRRRRT